MYAHIMDGNISFFEELSVRPPIFLILDAMHYEEQEGVVDNQE